jgi:hypothetical protein
MWRYWRIVDPRKAIILTGLLIAFVSTSIHLIQINAAARAGGVGSWPFTPAYPANLATACG